MKNLSLKISIGVIFSAIIMLFLLIPNAFGVENTISNVYVANNGGVSWSAYTGATKYRVTVNGTNHELTENTNDTFAGITESGTYTYTITAYSDAEGNTAIASYTGKVKYDGTNFAPLYKITFETNGGSAVEPQYLEPSGNIAQPADPTKADNTFIAWCSDPELNYEFYMGMPINSDTTLYAKFVSNDKVIKTINVTAVLPKAGDEVKELKKDNGYGGEYSEPSILPELTADNENIEIQGWYQDLTQEKNEYGEYPMFYGVFEANKEYGVLLDMYVKEGADFYIDKNVVVKLNGVAAEVGEYFVSNFRGAYGKIKLPGVEYNILDGANSTYDPDSGEDLIVRADGDQENFLYPKMDGVEIDTANYSTAVGSTILVLKANYLKTLAAGQHTLTFVYPDGEVSTKLNIAKAEDVATESQQTSATENSTTESATTEEVNEENNEEMATEESNTVKKTNPGTGDNIVGWIVLALVSGVVIFVVRKINKK